MDNPTGEIPEIPADAVEALRKALDQRVLARWFFRLMAGTHGVGAVVLGLVIVLGGYRRMASPAFDLVRTVPYAPYVWGVAILLCGLTVLAGVLADSMSVRSVGFLATAVTYGFFATALTTSVASAACTPVVCPAFTGTVTYTLIVLLSIEHAALAFVGRRLL